MRYSVLHAVALTTQRSCARVSLPLIASLTVLVGVPGAAAQSRGAQVIPYSINPGDTTPPVVTITPGSEQVSQPALAVTIDWCDDNTLNAASRAITLRGTNVTSSFSYTTSFKAGCTVHATSSGTVTLVAGTNYLNASIQDGKGNLGQKSATYTYVYVPPPYTAVRVTPDGAGVVSTPSATRTFGFTVENIGAASTTFAVVSHCAGSVTLCSAPGSVTLASRAESTVVVSYHAGAVGTSGTVSLVASAGTATDSGWISQSSMALVTGAPTLALVRADSLVARDQCVTLALASHAASECGDLRVVHALPLIRTFDVARAPVLLYNSQFAHPTPLLTLDVTLPAGISPPDTMSATIRIGSSTWTRSWAGDAWVPGSTRRITIPLSPWTMSSSVMTALLSPTADVAACYNGVSCVHAPLDTARIVVVDRSASPFGAGWWIAGLERLDPSTMLWTGGDGSVRQYVQDPAHPRIYRTVAVDRPDSLVKDSATGTFVRYDAHRLRVFYNASTGLHDSTVNRLGRRTIFQYTGGKLTQIVVPSPRASAPGYTFDYSVSGQVTIAAPPLGSTARTTTLLLASGALTAIRDPDYSQSAHPAISLVYDALDRLVSRTDKLGHTTRFTYDAAGKLAVDSVPEASGRWAVTLFRMGESRGVRDALVPDSAYTLWNGPRLDTTLVRIWLGRFGAPDSSIDALGRHTFLLHNDARFPGLVTELHTPNASASGLVTRAAYDAHGNVLVDSVFAPYGDGRTAVTRYRWDATYDFATAIVPPEQDSTTIRYDPATGNRLVQKNARGDSVAFSYVASSGLLASIQQEGVAGCDSVMYDSLGNMRMTRTPVGVLALTFRDAIGRPTLQITPTDSGNAARDSATLTQHGMRSYSFYDVMDRDTLVRTTAPRDPSHPVGADSLTLFVRTTRDLEGEPLAVARWTVPAPNTDTLTTHWTYDQAGRVATETAADGHVTTDVRDDAGNLVRVVTRRGDTLGTVYDALNRVTARVTPQVSYPEDYTLTPSLPFYSTGLTIPADTARFTYAPTGGLATATNYAAVVTRGYFPNGALAADTLRVRDVADTATSRHVYGLEMTYDLDGRRLTLVHPDALAPEQYGVPENTVSYQYDPGTGQLSMVTDLLGNHFGFTYDPAGRLTQRTLPGDVTEERGYDADGRLTWRTLGGPHFVGLDGRRQQNSTLIEQDTLWYDARGKVLGAITLNDTLAMTYDGLGALTSSWRGAFPRSAGGLIPSAQQTLERYQPDPLGQQDSVWVGATQSGRTHVYDRRSGELLRVATNSTDANLAGYLVDTNTYDAAGNLVVQRRTETVPTLFGGGSQMVLYGTYTRSYYDAAGKLRVVDHRAPWSPLLAIATRYASTFEETRYDALGRRVLARARLDSAYVDSTGVSALASFSTIERFAWDGSALLYEIRYPGSDFLGDSLERDTTENVRYKTYKCPPPQLGTCVDTIRTSLYGRMAYTYGAGVDRPLSMTRIGYQVDSTGMDYPPLTLIPHANWRGQLVKATDGTGKDFSITAQGIEWIDQQTSAYRWVQRVNDMLVWMGDLPLGAPTGSGLQYMRNRYYDPQTGRFTQEDPIGLAGGLNAYGYAAGDPITYSDPFGLCYHGEGKTAKANRTQSNVAACIPEPGLDGPGLADPLFLVGGLEEEEGVAAVEGGGKLVSRIGDVPALAKIASKLEGTAQGSIDRLTSQLAKGNLNPGIGTRYLFNGIFEARARDGARVYFRNVDKQGIEILAKSTKGTQEQVIKLLEKIYTPQ